MEHVRRAHADDLEALLRLAAAHEAEQRRWDPDFRLAPGWEQYYRRLVAAALEREGLIFWVAEQDGTPVGFLSTMTTSDPTWVDGTRANLLELYVAPACRRRGLGRALVTRALDEAHRQGVRITILNSFVHNEGATAFWRALGFAPFMLRMKHVAGAAGRKAREQG